MPVTHGVAGSSPVQTAIFKDVVCCGIGKTPVVTTSEKLSSEMEGFFCLTTWQYIGNKSYVFVVKIKNPKTSQALLSQTQGHGFQKTVFLLKQGDGI